MFSIPGYVPFCDVADLCLRAADQAPSHPKARQLPLLRDWATVDAEDQRRALRALGFLMADLTIQSGAELIICSPSGVILTPSQTLLSLSRHTPSLSLDDPIEDFLDYADGAYWRYEYLNVHTWCVQHKPTDPRDVDVDDESGEVMVDPMDIVADKFDGWALAMASDRADLTSAALFDARLAENAARATVLPVKAPIGRRNKIRDALKVYDKLYPRGHESARVPVKTVLATLAEEGHSISEPTLHRGLRNRKVNP